MPSMPGTVPRVLWRARTYNRPSLARESAIRGAPTRTKFLHAAPPDQSSSSMRRCGTVTVRTGQPHAVGRYKLTSSRETRSRRPTITPSVCVPSYGADRRSSEVRFERWNGRRPEEMGNWPRGIRQAAGREIADWPELADLAPTVSPASRLTIDKKLAISSRSFRDVGGVASPRRA